MRIQDVKLQAHQGREFLPVLVESVEKSEDGGLELALGAVEAGVDDFLAQELPTAVVNFSWCRQSVRSETE